MDKKHENWKKEAEEKLRREIERLEKLRLFRKTSLSKPTRLVRLGLVVSTPILRRSRLNIKRKLISDP